METLMVDRVHSSLRLFMHRNAVFLCERLCAQFPSETNVQLLATCYLHNNQPYAAYHVLKGKKLPESRYLFALSCFQMNLLREAEETLCPVNERNAEVPIGATGHYLLGVIYRSTGRMSVAAEQFTQALTLDPLLWAAYEELCILGVAEDADECFNEATALRLQQEHTSTSSLEKSDFANENRVLPSSVSTSLEDFSPKQVKHLHANKTSEIHGYSHGRSTALHAQNSATSNGAQFDTPSPTATQTIVPPPLFRNSHAFQSTINNFFAALFTNDESFFFLILGSRYEVIDEMCTDNIPAASSSVSLADGRPFEQDKAERILSQDSKVAVGIRELLGLLRTVGEAFRLSCLFKCQEALEVYRKLPETQFRTGWVLCQVQPLQDDWGVSKHAFNSCSENFSTLYNGVDHHNMESWATLFEEDKLIFVLVQVGKAYFELVDYIEADHYFELAHRLSPCTLDGMDIYSTVLYVSILSDVELGYIITTINLPPSPRMILLQHLNEEMRLSYLAQELISIDRLSPQAWCAVGNCFALRKDHETALKNFQRAVQLDSRFAYAHTLCGHEYSALEDYENSIKFYRCALQVDERHYNAWYGLGVVYLRQEKFEFAEHHFRRAFQINPRSSVLMCYLGMALHSLKVDIINRNNNDPL
ncbi:hypothetical protein PR202_gb27927 [Eleusine coracana subsp. coracana]|uniref:Cell division cycle protein 27 homolog B n=1 Tax=Eleusine coracana subsp. coracana TaxID=191504 RepID=A0AAV5FT42_ELECO|nr:hypothetical protein PR202_gb27927 [Eleusine coracana subsp. coracana]